MSPEYAAEWVRKAEADRRAAIRLYAEVRHDPDQAEVACFHAQQCAEKYMKAILALNSQAIPRTHDLWSLAESLRRFHFPGTKLRKVLDLLTQYAVEIRYPGTSASVAQAKRAVAAMERMVRACRPLAATAARKPH